jgi:hypothetical protein
MLRFQPTILACQHLHCRRHCIDRPIHWDNPVNAELFVRDVCSLILEMSVPGSQSCECVHFLHCPLSQRHQVGHPRREE